MDERGGRTPEPLSDQHDEAHVGLSSGPQIRQPARRTTEHASQIGPGETALSTLRVEFGVDLWQVPSEPTAESRFRQLRVAYVDDGAPEELLWRPAEPAQHEERVLTGGRVTRAQSPDGPTSKGMIDTVRVELGRLLPERVGELVPVQTLLATTGVKRCEERCDVELGMVCHSAKLRTRSDLCRARLALTCSGHHLPYGCNHSLTQ